MTRFSERLGYVEARSVIQTSELDSATRIAMWNSAHELLTHIEQTNDHYDNSPERTFMRLIWGTHFERPIDEFRMATAVALLKATHLSHQWVDVLDVVEFISANAPVSNGAKALYVRLVSSDLEKYLVGFRLIGTEIVPVSDPAEVDAIESAMSGQGVGAGARTHLQRATQLLGNRTSPQFAKVIAESVSAVESLIFELTGEKTLSGGLKKLDAKGVSTHSALLVAWEKLYGYASDAAGIRHGLVRDEDATEPLAIYFLVTCSSFINLLLKQSHA